MMKEKTRLIIGALIILLAASMLANIYLYNTHGRGKTITAWRTTTLPTTYTVTRPETVVTITSTETRTTTYTYTSPITTTKTITWTTTITNTITAPITSTITITSTTTETSTTKKQVLRQAIMYQGISWPPEGYMESVEIINGLKPWMDWYSIAITGFPPPPNTTMAYKIALSLGLSSSAAEKFAEWVNKTGYSLEEIHREVEALHTLYCPAILVQNLRADYNYDPLTFKPIPREKLEEMALDYSKWGLPLNKTRTQEIMHKLAGLPRNAVFPDITNKDYQEYLLRKIEALKRVGVKCVWLDMLFAQANIAYSITHDYDHPAVKEAYMAAVKIVQEIKKMGIMVGSWSDWVIYPYSIVPLVDFVTRKITSREVIHDQINTTFWKETVQLIRNKTDATILMVFDFAPRDNTPLALFSQKLSTEQ